jgi:hypothetical protein
VVTTNYDDLMEAAYVSAREEFDLLAYAPRAGPYPAPAWRRL